MATALLSCLHVHDDNVSSAVYREFAFGNYQQIWWHYFPLSQLKEWESRRGKERVGGSERKRVHRKKNLLCVFCSCLWLCLLFFFNPFFLARMCICHAHALLVCLSCNTVAYKYLYSSFDPHIFCFFPPFFEVSLTTQNGVSDFQGPCVKQNTFRTFSL